MEGTGMYFICFKGYFITSTICRGLIRSFRSGLEQRLPSKQAAQTDWEINGIQGPELRAPTQFLLSSATVKVVH